MMLQTVDWFFEQPLWLWLVALSLPSGALGVAWFRSMTAPRRWSAILLRTILLTLLAMMLAGFSLRKTTSKLAVVAVVDVSGSVRRFYRPPEQLAAATPPIADAQDAVRAFLRAACAARGPDDLVGVVAFDGESVAIATPTGSDAWTRDFVTARRDGTDIARALDLARALIPPDAAGRILLFSDGNETMGDAREAAQRAAAAQARSRVRIDVAPLTYRLGEEVIVEAVDAPPSAPGQATVNVRVVLTATTPSRGTLRLLREGAPIDLDPASNDLGRRISLNPGRNVELIEVALPPGRVHRFHAIYEPDALAGATGAAPTLSGDTVVENNAGDAFTITPGKGSVLLVSAVASSDYSSLAGALRRSGIDVSVVGAEACPPDLLALQAFDMVMFENVPAEAVPTQTQQALVAFVRDVGGGLAMIGGPDSFGAGGWKGTPLADILPLRLDLPDRITAPEVATVFVLDNSGSMRRPVLGSWRSQQQIANEAAAIAIASLDRNDLVGVVAFNSNAQTIVPLARNDKPERSVARVRDIDSGGGTDAVDGMELALSMLEPAQAKIKHIVLLTDGKSQREQHLPELADRCAAGAIKLSTIAVGDDADLQLLANLAERGAGTYFHASNPNSLPKLFLKAVKVVRSPLIREGDFDPVVMPVGSPLTAGLVDAPPLGGLVLTQRRPEPTALVAMMSAGGDPLLAHWSVGLGQVVAFTSDAGQWAQRWLDWPGYDRLWTQVVRMASRPPGVEGLSATASSSPTELRLRLDASGPAAAAQGIQSVTATVFAPDGSSRDVAMTATAPGVYQAALPVTQSGSYVALIKPTQAGKPAAPIIVGATIQEGAEYRVLASNEHLLADVARVSGGRVLDIAQPAQSNLFDRTGIVPAEAITPLWRTLIVWALVALLLDIATRRVAWDRFFSPQFQVQGLPAGATAGLASIRARLERTADAPAAVALGEEDARRLAAAARDRRRAQRLEEFTRAAAPIEDHGATSQPTTTPDHAHEPPLTPLQAAKERARRRFDEEK